jgi:hypothetical protein
MFVNVESKKTKCGVFAEGSWQIRSATLGKIFLARVFQLCRALGKEFF